MIEEAEEDTQDFQRRLVEFVFKNPHLVGIVRKPTIALDKELEDAQRPCEAGHGGEFRGRPKIHPLDLRSRFQGNPNPRRREGLLQKNTPNSSFWTSTGLRGNSDVLQWKVQAMHGLGHKNKPLCGEGLSFFTHMHSVVWPLLTRQAAELVLDLKQLDGHTRKYRIQMTLTKSWRFGVVGFTEEKSISLPDDLLLEKEALRTKYRLDERITVIDWAWRAGKHASGPSTRATTTRLRSWPTSPC